MYPQMNTGLVNVPGAVLAKDQPKNSLSIGSVTQLKSGLDEPVQKLLIHGLDQFYMLWAVRWKCSERNRGVE